VGECAAGMAASARCYAIGRVVPQAMTRPPMGACHLRDNPSMDMPVSPACATTALPAGRWRNGFAALDAAFYTPLAPTPLPDPYWVGASARVAELLHLPAQWMQS